MTAPTPDTILVIDDDPMIRLMARETLADAGFCVVDAPDAQAGLARFEATPADLVLLDLLMPGLNGYEACRGLRASSAGQNVPIIVMTGLDDRASIQQAYESGATDFITKPMVWDLLPYRVRYALRASQALRDSVQSQALLAASQRIAQMGSWEWRSGSNALSCSDELQRIHGFTRDPARSAIFRSCWRTCIRRIGMRWTRAAGCAPATERPTRLNFASSGQTSACAP